MGRYDSFIVLLFANLHVSCVISPGSMIASIKLTPPRKETIHYFIDIFFFYISFRPTDFFSSTHRKVRMSGLLSSIF